MERKGALTFKWIMEIKLSEEYIDKLIRFDDIGIKDGQLEHKEQWNLLNQARILMIE